MSNQLVSVIIASFNGHDRIGKAINSVLEQTHYNFEILIVDDASKPPLDTIVGEFDDPRIRYIRIDKNSGCHAARAEAIKYVTGDFVALLDDDDYWIPNKIEKQLSVISKNPKIGLVCCGAIDIYPDGSSISRIPISKVISHEMELVDERTIASSVLFRRTAYDESGGFDQTLRRCGDWDCWIRISKSYEIRSISNTLIRTEMRKNSLQRSDDIDSFRQDRWKVIEKHREEIEKLGLMGQCTAAHLQSIGTRFLRIGEFQNARKLLAHSIYNKFRLLTFIALLCSCMHIKGDKYLRIMARKVKCILRDKKE